MKTWKENNLLKNNNNNMSKLNEELVDAQMDIIDKAMEVDEKFRNMMNKPVVDLDPQYLNLFYPSVRNFISRNSLYDIVSRYFVGAKNSHTKVEISKDSNDKVYGIILYEAYDNVVENIIMTSFTAERIASRTFVKDVIDLIDNLVHKYDYVKFDMETDSYNQNLYTKALNRKHYDYTIEPTSSGYTKVSIRGIK